MLLAYFDDSGTHTTSPVTVMGGLVGTTEQWSAFEARWRERLRSPIPGKRPLKQFHLSHCRAHGGEFERYSEAESDLVTREFREIIANSGLISVASVVNNAAWEELVKGPIRDRLETPLVQCSVNCIDEAIKITKVHSAGPKLTIVFDQGIESIRLREIADIYTRHVGGNPWIVSIRFATVEQMLPLQGADMAATESFWQAQKFLAGGDDSDARPHFQAYMKSIRGEGLIMDRADILENVQRVQAEISLEKQHS
jgi:Protein of unknown function (DUF3800)